MLYESCQALMKTLLVSNLSLSQAVDEVGIDDTSTQTITYPTIKIWMAICWLLCMSMVTFAA